MPAKKKAKKKAVAKKSKSNGIKWTAARRAAHGKKIAEGRSKSMATILTRKHEAQPQANDSLREQIRAAVRAELPTIVDEELRALLGG